ncbi:MAG: calcium/sodium antiporter [Candidatus Algichlamydia australiensis]|nr:calcium/sodium antiporter [Chlamydiales bacterium]
MTILFAILAIVLGTLLLHFGGEKLLHSSIAVARGLGLSNLVIGIFVVAVATSMPEVLTSVIAQFKGMPGDIAMGNVLGSNIANIAVVLGVSLLISPCKLTKEIRFREMAFMTGALFLILAIMWIGPITFRRSLLLFAALIGYLAFHVIKAKKERKPRCRKTQYLKESLLILIATVLLFLGARFLLYGAVEIATWFGISARVISLTLIAIGTSLPELATAIAAARRNEEEVVLGNVIGSNIFNPLLILPAAALVHPIVFSKEMFVQDAPLVLVFTLLLWGMLALSKKLTRYHGMALLLAYFLYILYLY